MQNPLRTELGLQAKAVKAATWLANSACTATNWSNHKNAHCTQLHNTQSVPRVPDQRTHAESQEAYLRC